MDYSLWSQEFWLCAQGVSDQTTQLPTQQLKVTSNSACPCPIHHAPFPLTSPPKDSGRPSTCPSREGRRFLDSEPSSLPTSNAQNLRTVLRHCCHLYTSFQTLCSRRHREHTLGHHSSIPLSSRTFSKLLTREAPHHPHL